MLLVMQQISQYRLQIEQSAQRKYQSYKLADELRQSSDDLTRMVRTYTVTANPAYKNYFQRILDIRNGVVPRPKGYSRIFWDTIIPGDGKLEQSQSNDAISLQQLMRNMGFTSAELAKLQEALAKSDQLVNLENRAMAAMEGLYPDDYG